MNDKLIEQALHFDAIGEAEKHLGAKLEDHPDGLAMGILYSQDRRNVLSRLLQQSGDVYDHMDYEDYTKTVEGWGFERIYEEKFLNDRDVPNYQRIFWHPDGLLLVTDSYSWSIEDMPSRTTNRATVYYNVQFTKEQRNEFFRYTSSGCCEIFDEKNDDYVWCGDHDARDALKHKLTGLKENGTFLSEWRVAPFIHLNHYGERRKCTDKMPWEEVRKIWNQEVEAKLDKFPAELAEMIRKARAAKAKKVFKS